MVSLRASSQIYVGGPLTADITFTPDNNPYIVTQDLIVNEGVTLTILPGVVMDFYYGTGIISNGTLIAKGKSNRRIIFRPKNPLPYPGQWDGITFNNTKTVLLNQEYQSGSIIAHAHISKASYGVTADLNSSVLVDSCTFERSSFGVFVADASYNIIRRNTFKNCDFAIFLAGGYSNPNNMIYSNIIIESSDAGIFINNFPESSCNQSILNNYFSKCSIGVHAGNYGLHGSGKHVINENVFYQNGTAIKLFHDSSLVKNNYFTNDTSALVGYGSSYNIITQNFFAGNFESGLSLLSNSSYNTISYNSFSYNKLGLHLNVEGGEEKPLFNTILYNSFYRNSPAGSLVCKAEPQGPIQFNNFKHNGNYQSFSNTSLGELHAEYCYWGVASLSAVDSIILDKKDVPTYGEVLYKPIFIDELTISPILPPNYVSKQLIGNRIFVKYCPSDAIDVAGYSIYFGKSNATGFEQKASNGNSLGYWINSSGIFDTIAVTAYDNQADGWLDQPQGHESCFAFAKLIPFAGADTAICFNTSYSITNANAINFSSIAWSSSGDGSFSNPYSLQTIYTPGPADFLQGFTLLTLTGYNTNDTATDNIKITYHDEPVISLPSDTTVIVENGFVIPNVDIAGYDRVKWTTSGDGIFNYDTLVSPYYTPGTNDLLAEEVTLTCTAISACGSASESIEIYFSKGFSITGTVKAGDMPIAECNVVLYNDYAGKLAKAKSSTTSNDGSFTVSGLLEGNYYLYAIPQNSSPYENYLPTYYYHSLSWENAYHLPLTQNAYDVDIKLVRKNVVLPAGNASIHGIITPLGGGNTKCTDVTILLYDNSGKNVLGYARVDNGNTFSFSNLPYGSYILIGEKAGFSSFISEPLHVSPQNPTIDNVEIFCSATGLSFKAIPGNAPEPSRRLTAAPNPFDDRVTLFGIDLLENPEIKVYNYQGIAVTYSVIKNVDNSWTVDIQQPVSGVYFIEVKEGNRHVQMLKVIKL